MATAVTTAMPQSTRTSEDRCFNAGTIASPTLLDASVANPTPPHTGPASGRELDWMSAVSPWGSSRSPTAAPRNSRPQNLSRKQPRRVRTNVAGWLDRAFGRRRSRPVSSQTLRAGADDSRPVSPPTRESFPLMRRCWTQAHHAFAAFRAQRLSGPANNKSRSLFQRIRTRSSRHASPADRSLDCDPQTLGPDGRAIAVDDKLAPWGRLALYHCSVGSTVPLISEKYFHDHFAVSSLLGRGSFGEVRRCCQRATGELCAVKIFHKCGPRNPVKRYFFNSGPVGASAASSSYIRNMFFNEISVLSRLKHPNVIQVYTAFETEAALYAIMELCDGKDVFHYIAEAIKGFRQSRKCRRTGAAVPDTPAPVAGCGSELASRTKMSPEGNQNGPLAASFRKLLPESRVVALLRSILAALAYLREQGCVHRDVKAQNLLFANATTQSDDSDASDLSSENFKMQANSPLPATLQSPTGTAASLGTCVGARPPSSCGSTNDTNVNCLESTPVVRNRRRHSNRLPQCRVVLTDFGMSTFLDDSTRLSSVCGSAHYIAPEILRKQSYGFEVDMWAVGVIAYLMVYGSYPFTGPRRSVVLQGICRLDPVFPTSSRGIRAPRDITIDFLKRCLDKCPETRLTPAEALRHPWLA